MAAETGAQYAKVSVVANSEWQSSKLSVSPNQWVCVSADGLWSHGDEGDIYHFYGADGSGNPDPTAVVPWPRATIGTLLGRIGDGVPFALGSQRCFVSKRAGLLAFEINDAPGTFGNNLGSLLVQVTVENQAHYADETSSHNCASPSMYFRGSASAWGNVPLKCVREQEWGGVITLSAPGAFKLDTFGDWKRSWGDNPVRDGYLDLGGANIPVAKSGKYRLIVNEKTRYYHLDLIVPGP